jgi:hypothetical protein
MVGLLAGMHVMAGGGAVVFGGMFVVLSGFLRHSCPLDFFNIR